MRAVVAAAAEEFDGEILLLELSQPLRLSRRESSLDYVPRPARSCALSPSRSAISVVKGESNVPQAGSQSFEVREAAPKAYETIKTLDDKCADI
jgi:hypothetical protein